MKKLFLGLMAAACILTSCDKVEELANELTDNQAPTMVESKDGLQTTVSFKVAGVVEYSFVVDYEVSAKGDTICKMATTTAKYFLQAVADQAWEEVLAAKSQLQEEYDRIQAQMALTTDKEKLAELQIEADALENEIFNYEKYNYKKDKTIYMLEPDVAGISKRTMKQTLTWTLENYKAMYDGYRKYAGKND